MTKTAYAMQVLTSDQGWLYVEGERSIGEEPAKALWVEDKSDLVTPVSPLNYTDTRVATLSYELTFN